MTSNKHYMWGLAGAKETGMKCTGLNKYDWCGDGVYIALNNVHPYGYLWRRIAAYGLGDIAYNKVYNGY